MRVFRQEMVIFCGLILLTGVLVGDNRVPQSATDARKGVAFLKGYRDGKSIIGTGFLLDEQIVITNAHVVAGISTMYAEFEGEEKIDCSLIDSNSDIDLAALALNRPLKNRALVRRKNVKVVQGQDVFLVGNPLGLKWSVHPGVVSAIRSVGEIAEALGLSEPNNSDQMAYQLDINSTFGMSGAPVLNRDGEVIGIQKEGWKDGLGGINFCIPQASVDSLNLTKNPTRFGGRVTLKNDFKDVGLQKQSFAQPQVRVEDRVVDVGCQHWGFVPSDVDFVFDKYIGDKARFGFTMPRGVVQEILRRHKVVHVTNSAFGLSFLVPDNYELSQSPQKSPPALTLTLVSRDQNLPNQFKRIELTASRISAITDEDALSRKVKDMVESFVQSELHLEVHEPFSNVPARSEKDAEINVAASDTEPRVDSSRGVARYHVMYNLGAFYNKSWNIYAAVAGETATLTVYSNMTTSRIPGVSPDSAERQFIAETVSFDILNRTY